MLFRTALLSAIALLSIHEAVAADVEADVDGGDIQIATSPFYACNCPNNCRKKSGSGCKFYSGVSSNSPVSSGKCQWQGDYLMCVVTS